MREKQRGSELAEVEKPTEFSPTEKKLDASELLDAINEVGKGQAVEYWSCANGAYRKGHCGCEDGTDKSKPGGWGAGGQPGAPIYFSTRRTDWHTPVRVDATGELIRDPNINGVFVQLKP